MKNLSSNPNIPVLPNRRGNGLQPLPDPSRNLETVSTNRSNIPPVNIHIPPGTVPSNLPTIPPAGSSLTTSNRSPVRNRSPFRNSRIPPPGNFPSLIPPISSPKDNTPIKINGEIVPGYTTRQIPINKSPVTFYNNEIPKKIVKTSPVDF